MDNVKKENANALMDGKEEIVIQGYAKIIVLSTELVIMVRACVITGLQETCAICPDALKNAPAMEDACLMDNANVNQVGQEMTVQ